MEEPSSSTTLLIQEVTLRGVLSLHIHGTGPTREDEHETIVCMKIFVVLSTSLIGKAHILRKIDDLFE